jgi:hypothetical protein
LESWTKIKISFVALLILFCLDLSAQEASDSIMLKTDTLPATFDTAEVKKLIWYQKINPLPAVNAGFSALKQNYPKPKTAAHFGLFFPGGGQLYNKDFWKVPLVWGAYGYLGYLIIDNTGKYRDFRSAVLARINEEPDPYPQFSLPGLRRQRDFFRKNMERAYIGLVAVHALSALEAFVACHLRQFDISDQLSFHVLESSPLVYTQTMNVTPIASIKYTIK